MRCPLLASLLLAAVGQALAEAECPQRCSCPTRSQLSCRGAQLREVPPLRPDLFVLDLSANNISTLHRASLQPAYALRDLDLSENRLEAVSSGAFGELRALQRLVLSRCALRTIPAYALRPLHALHHLWLDDNELSEVEAEAIAPLRSLRWLRLDRNRLRRVPTDALRHLQRLHTLELAGNLIAELDEESLPPLPALDTLVLRGNRIAHVDERALSRAPALRHLRLEGNLLTELPVAVSHLPRLQKLWLSANRIDVVEPGALQPCALLVHLDLRGNPLRRLHPRALDHLASLTTLVLSDASGLRELPALNGSSALHTLLVDRAQLEALPPQLCRYAPALHVLDLNSNLLSRVPDLHECGDLSVLQLSWNRISSLEEWPLRGLDRLTDLLLAHNQLRSLPRDVFKDAPRLRRLDLEGNRIEHIDSETFVPVSALEDLNVGENRFPRLPAGGLQRLRHLKAHNNPRLRTFHTPEVFPRIETLVLSYAYHCCEFMPLMKTSAEAGDERPASEAPRRALSGFVLVPGGARVDPAVWANTTDLWPYVNASGAESARLHDAMAAWERESAEEAAQAEAAQRSGGGAGGGGARGRVSCVPRPGPFMPCVDLFDWWTLRCGVWAVFLLALLGNGTVVLVLVLSRSRMDVPRFLVANLAAADFCMGLYLGFLAVVDAGTLGEFRTHALSWQRSGACGLAGFLGVLSSELSVYTLAVITLERNYAITHAMHLNKRLSLRHAAAVMGGGWVFSLVAATLPLLGVSDYRKFAVCLPFETGSPLALGYVVMLLAVNGLAFVVLLGCYLRMYCAIRGSQAWNSNDSRIAKRMALLVFTDFLCWAPIALCALTAAFGVRLVSLEQAKVLTVFVLPLNSCCNPFLYAILTKQFKKDCALVCKQIEESRVTRGIGRCRHSSNFSNRQTPANTNNSLMERSSRGQHAPTCACRRLLPPPPAPAPSVPRATRRRVERARLRLLRWLGACGRGEGANGAAGAGGVGSAGGAGGAVARAGSMSSSVEFSSSRSDSWRACGGRPPPPRRAASWLITRKTSQDSNLSSSRNDSSGSNATVSTGTWRTSRSGQSSSGTGPAATAAGGVARPRLTRQPAVLGEEPPASPARSDLPRQLQTIPSAAEPEPQAEDSEAAR